jgi:tRNA/rRNA methyltransferase
MGKAEKLQAAGDPARADQLERLSTMLLNALGTSGYLKTGSNASEGKVRRLVRRLNLAAADAETLLGMLRQMLWKMKP